ncbi:MAG: hypothetical protein ACHQ16_01585 [Candidatus Lutacidiplasmatales archaeon]
MFTSGHCAGLYPFSGQGTYYDGCIGHDEPGIEFYSNLPGSGGNFTWNVTLPIDKGPSQNQSNLYVAVWFGMTLNDPLAWMNQCFLEVQLYPDSTYDAYGNSLPLEGRWVGAAVAWQIEAATGYEDPCYYQLLYKNGVPGPGYFNMTGGDKLSVTMDGWATSPYGENLSIVDRTSGNRTNLTLFDPYGLFPLNPSYSTSSYENGLQWTPGGEYPVAFAFETGHGRDPSNPGNSAFNYCAPGRPPLNTLPCPSYDPGSWANDTVAPWQIGVPTFHGPNGSSIPGQVAFTQDLGGIALDDQYTGCPGNEGSEYCSYPWYSYSCSANAFEFGATDYLGVTSDFGKYHQYATVAETNDLGFGYYAPTNFTIPTCGGPAFSLGIGFTGPSTGQVYFLSQAYSVGQTLAGLSPGAYAIHAIGRPGARFGGWNTTGGASVDINSSAYATVTLSGNGSVVASFGAIAPVTVVTFDDSVANASVAVNPSYLLIGVGQPIAKLTNGTWVALASQIYSIAAYPPQGYNFTRWSVNSGGAVVAAPYFPDSWFVVTGTASNVTVEAWYTATNVVANVYVYSGGGGSVDFNGTSTTYSYLVVPVGTYAISALPSPGWAFVQWQIFGSTVWTDMRNVTNVTLESGTSYVEAYFAPVVTIDIAAPGSGVVAFYPPAQIGNGTQLNLYPGNYYPVAVPYGGFAFSDWTVNNSAAGWVNGSATSVEGSLVINSSVTVTAHFAPMPKESLSFNVTGSGMIGFNFQRYYDATTNFSVCNGSYFLEFFPFSGFTFYSANTTGPDAIVGSNLVVSGSGGYITVKFVPTTPSDVPLTFISTPSNATRASLNGSAYAHGATVWVLPGTYLVQALSASNTTFLSWSWDGRIAVASNVSQATNITVRGGGTLYAYSAPFAIDQERLNFSPTDVNQSVEYWAVASGVGPFSYTWSGLPPGCNSTEVVPVHGLWCVAQAAGNFTIGLSVSDGSGVTLTAPPRTLIVNPWPKLLSFTASRTLLDIGATTILSASVVGGSGVYSYSYSPLPAGCPAVNFSSFRCVPQSTGTTTVGLVASDGLGGLVWGNVTLTVRPLPTVSAFTPGPATVTEGVPTTLAVTVVNGVGPFTYVFSGLPTGCTTQNHSRVNCTAAAAGSFPIDVAVTDADGAHAVGHTTLTVNAAPRVTAFTATPASLVIGNSTVLAVATSGGTGTIRFLYGSLPPGCTPGNRSSLSCTPDQVGTFSAQVTISDSFGVEDNGSVTLTVTNPVVVPVKTGESPAGGLSAFLLLGLVLLIVVVAAVALALWWRHRSMVRRTDRSPSGPSGPDDPSPPAGSP